MLLSYNQLMSKIVNGGVVKNVDPANVNGTSIDIRLGNTLLVETHPVMICPTCKAHQREQHDIDIKRRSVRYSRVLCQNNECNEAHPYAAYFPVIDIAKKTPLSMEEKTCDEGFELWPGEAVLASSMEVFYLPSHITAEYRLKSSMARVFLEHLHAGWCDPMWQGSVLTLELVNMNRYHPLMLHAGMKVGQMCFYQHDPVPVDQSYAVKGQYNNAKGVQQSKGVK